MKITPLYVSSPQYYEPNIARPLLLKICRIGQQSASHIFNGDLTLHTCFSKILLRDVALYAKEHFEKSVKKTLTIPAWLNKAALEQGVNFSQVLQDALKAKLHLG